MKGGLGTQAAYEVIRRHVPYMAEDRDLYIDIETLREVIRQGEVVDAVEAAVGEMRWYARRARRSPDKDG
jgi:histidine ammonia-lyase